MSEQNLSSNNTLKFWQTRLKHCHLYIANRLVGFTEDDVVLQRALIRLNAMPDADFWNGHLILPIDLQLADLLPNGDIASAIINVYTQELYAHAFDRVKSIRKKLICG